MARLLYQDNQVVLDASEGEELSPEIVRAWAAQRSASALESVAENIAGLADEVARIAENG